MGIITLPEAAPFYQPRDSHVLDTAWALSPHLLASEIRDESRKFIAGLCSVSVGRGNRKLRQGVRTLVEYFDRLADRSVVSEACLGCPGIACNFMTHSIESVKTPDTSTG